MKGKPSEIGAYKLGIMASETQFKLNVLSKFTEYFKPLKPLASNLRKVLFPRLDYGDVTHGEVDGVLNEAISHLVSVEGSEGMDEIVGMVGEMNVEV
jgi:hypothetical protein